MSSTIPRGIGDRADGVDARELVDVAAEAARRRRVALEQEELELGADDRRRARARRSARRRARAGRAGTSAPGRSRPAGVGVADAPGDVGLPRHDAQRREVGPDREVDVALLAADDRRVPEVGATSPRRRTRRPPRRGARTSRSGCPCRARSRAGRCRASRIARTPRSCSVADRGLRHATPAPGSRLTPLKKFERSRSAGPAARAGRGRESSLRARF